jgi:hypothetical protein
MSGSVDRKVRPPWHPRKKDKVHLIGNVWIPERAAFILVIISLAVVVIFIANAYHLW